MASLRTYYPLVHRKAVPEASLPANISSSVVPPRKPVPTPQPTLEVGDRPQQNHGDQPHTLQDSASEVDFYTVDGLLQSTSYHPTSRTAYQLVPDRDRPVGLFSLDDLLDGESLVFPDEDEDHVAGATSSTLDPSASIERHRQRTLHLLTQNEREPEQSSVSSRFQGNDALSCDDLHTNDASQHDSLLEPDNISHAEPETSPSFLANTTSHPPSPNPPAPDNFFATTSHLRRSSYDGQEE